jgi:hypothetical protein
VRGAYVADRIVVEDIEDLGPLCVIAIGERFFDVPLAAIACRT